jgi:hypothetical protein
VRKPFSEKESFMLQPKGLLTTVEVLTMTSDSLRRYRGCLLGLAIGDAVGTTLEFQRPGTFEPINDMVGGGPFGLKPGEWTDDPRGFDLR